MPLTTKEHSQPYIVCYHENTKSTNKTTCTLHTHLIRIYREYAVNPFMREDCNHPTVIEWSIVLLCCVLYCAVLCCAVCLCVVLPHTILFIYNFFFFCSLCFRVFYFTALLSKIAFSSRFIYCAQENRSIA